MAPLSLLDTYSGSSLRFGLEKKAYHNVAYYIELGGYMPWLSDWNGLSNNTGITAKLECKLYANKHQKCEDIYYSVELFNKYEHYSTLDSISIPAVHPYRTSYTVYKNITCLTFKFGQTRIWRRKFLIDSFVGIGLRYHSCVNSLSNTENDNVKSADDYGTNRSESHAGKYFLPNIDLGVKVGYIIH